MLVDVHAHLDQYNKLDSIIQRANKNNVVKIITNGTDSKSNRKNLDISKKYENVELAMGLFPIEALKLSEKEIEKEINFIKKNKNNILAIGEVGLDYYHNKDYKKQRIIFEKFIKLSEKLKLPIIVHSRKAEKEVIDMLLSSKTRKVVLHCFSGNKKLINSAIDNNFLFSIPTIIKRSTHFQNLVKITPLKQLLTETDSPLISPFIGKVNEPSFVSESIKKISEIKQISKKETEKIIFMNFQNTFLFK